MIRETVTVDEAIAFLNVLVRIEPDTMHRLVNNRVRCGRSFAEHESVQVGEEGGMTWSDSWAC